ncbi:hypothetical protein Kpol_1058p14 [Vanderwaltozyma polyspora DSM 70294]|uniref:PROP1-like PPR domain-containing protein n=1 Tax=Vanderwaltozyma polyspora (strain ATCC 22028 / DSM 70294 / BCRC 21397 / CBS 2163 / NBRC 10782 / NRRL Y-8283 / UCD 57-17) TaxID=436907 RepID=A7TJP8_VANPO|nr:uncharacterized protein Kpol_1058p14 [Vanderwaltozyma polyspora DSM 70294]EDO17477.1 hypothetical protein Kpol_1058p14 [Vanderwaltozyma polyspora DSM 70294]
MFRATLPVFRVNYGIQWHRGIPLSIKSILNRERIIGVEEDDCKELLQYFGSSDVAKTVTSTERIHVIRYFYERGAYDSVVNIGQKMLYKLDQSGRLRDDVTLNELKSFINSHGNRRLSGKYDLIVEDVISQWCPTNKVQLVKLIESLFHRLINTKKYPPHEALSRWAYWITLINGNCEFVSYLDNKVILKKLLYYMREHKQDLLETGILDDTFKLINQRYGSNMTSQFASTLLYLATYNKDYKLVEKIWSYKVENKLPVKSRDLTSILKTYCYLGSFGLVKSTYDKYPDAHNDQNQFDYLLIAHSKSYNWTSLQKEFDSLFGIGKLPNIRQYGIVMNTMADIGELKSVDRLFTQLLRRGMSPTYTVLQSMIHAHLKAGDFHGCFSQFENFEKFNVEPSASTYLMMFKVYKGLNNIDGALRLMRKMTDESKVQITEGHFTILIGMCANITNYQIAQELFDIMTKHYDIVPTGNSVAALMEVYISSNLPQESLKLFKRYALKKSVDEALINVYNKAIRAYTKMNQKEKTEDLFKKILELKLKPNKEFFRVMLEYLTVLQRDFKTSEEVIDRLLTHESVRITPNHFEILMAAYDKISYNEGVLALYSKMNENRVPINSRILYYLIKAAFKAQSHKNGDINEAIELVEDIITNTANKTLDVTFSRPHPSIIAWPMRVITKHSKPSKALELLNRYNKLFYESHGQSSNHRFVVMRSLLVLSAHIEEWDGFEDIFEKYISRIEKFQDSPTATVKNRRMKSLVVGLFNYKVKQLVETNKIIELPQWLERIEKLGLYIDNPAWNAAILALFKDERTIEHGMKIIDKKFIHGYNLIHKCRMLRKIGEKSVVSDKSSWFIQKKKNDPNSLTPTLYLESETYNEVIDATDKYLSTVENITSEIKRLVNNYKYFMKNYLLKSHDNVNNWDLVEREYSEFLNEVRTTKRASSIL